jgi:MFS family permease
VTGAALLPGLRRRGSTDAIIAIGSSIFGLACFGIGFVRALWLLSPIFFVGGIAWMAVLSSLNLAAQNVSPSWVRARALAVYLLVFQAGIAGGSVLWGAIATAAGLSAAFSAAGAGLILGTLALTRVRLAKYEHVDLTPTRHWPAPAVVGEPSLEAGPVLVEIEYRIDPARAAEFIAAARALEPIRRRDGAVEWWLLRNSEDAACYTEVFAVETWAEHLRQHDRASAPDRDVEERVLAFQVGEARPPTRHLIAAGSEPTVRSMGLPT